MDQHHTVKYILDGAAIVGAFTSFAQVWGPIVSMLAASLSIVWLTIQIAGWVKKQFS